MKKKKQLLKNHTLTVLPRNNAETKAIWQKVTFRCKQFVAQKNERLKFGF